MINIKNARLLTTAIQRSWVCRQHSTNKTEEIDLNGLLVNRSDDKEIWRVLNESSVMRDKHELFKQAQLESEQFAEEFLAGRLELEPPESSKLVIMKKNQPTQQPAENVVKVKPPKTRKSTKSEVKSSSPPPLDDLSISKNELAKECADQNVTLKKPVKTKGRPKKVKEEVEKREPDDSEKQLEARLKEIEREGKEKKELIVRKYQKVLAKSFLDTDFLLNRMHYFPIESKERVTGDLNYYTPEEVSACQISLFNHVENSSLLDYQLPTVYEVMEVATTMSKSLQYHIAKQPIAEKQLASMIEKQAMFKEYLLARQQQKLSSVSPDNFMLEAAHAELKQRLETYLDTKIQDIKLMNKEVVHSKLFYRAKLDGVWLIKKDQDISSPSSSTLVYLKMSANKKDDIKAWHNHPLRAVAAYGALKRDKELENEHDLKQVDSLTLINFSESSNPDCSTPDTCVLSKQQIEMYWSRWLQALRTFWLRVYKHDAV